MPAPSAKKLAELLSAAAADVTFLGSEDGRRLLAESLSSREPRVTVLAANLVREHTLRGLEAPLAAAYRAFATERANADPGCLAKEALLAALDAVESSDTELFAEAAVYFQRERVKGSKRDTAARVRQRGVLGLSRVGHRDAMPIFGACLADRDATVRLAAARSIAHHGHRDGAGLLLLKLGLGDEEAEIVVECLHALFAVAPDFAARHARAALSDDRRREATLQALGTAPDDGAVELLAAELAREVLAEEKRRVIEALGLSLRPRARSILLDLVRKDEDEAEAALAALSIHRYDERLVEQAREAAAHSRVLSRRFAELFKK